MNQKGSAPVIILLIVVGILVIGGIWYYDIHKSPADVPQIQTGQSTLENSTTTGTSVSINSQTISVSSSVAVATTTQAVTCTFQTTDITDIPPLPYGFDWTSVTSTNTASVFGSIPVIFSSSTGEFLDSDAFSLEPFDSSSTTTLSGRTWFAPGNNLGDLDSYYRSALLQEGWSSQIDIDGYKIYGEQAGGYHGEVDGYVKVENDDIRTITLNYLFKEPGQPTYLIVFLSDITPLSEVISGYVQKCPHPDSGQLFTLSEPTDVSSQIIENPPSLVLSGGTGQFNGDNLTAGVNTIDGINFTVIPFYDIGQTYNNKIGVFEVEDPPYQAWYRFQNYKFVVQCGAQGYGCNMDAFDGDNEISSSSIGAAEAYGPISIETFSYGGRDYFVFNGTENCGTDGCNDNSVLYSNVNGSSTSPFLLWDNSWGWGDGNISQSSWGDEDAGQLEFAIAYNGNMFLIPTGYASVMELDASGNKIKEISQTSTSTIAEILSQG